MMHAIDRHQISRHCVFSFIFNTINSSSKMKIHTANNAAVAMLDEPATIDLHQLTPDNPKSRRGIFLKWLRKTHGWIGLWVAALGLLFGVTGFLQNHRAIMKIPTAQAQ